VAQDNALSGGGAEAGPLTPQRLRPTFESVMASSFVLLPTNRDQGRFRQIRDNEEPPRQGMRPQIQPLPDTSASARRQGKRPMPGQGRLGRGILFITCEAFPSCREAFSSCHVISQLSLHAPKVMIQAQERARVLYLILYSTKLQASPVSGFMIRYYERLANSIS
jgi:hypothetical protein